MFVGRPIPGPGEPLFLPEDTAAAIALAEEERDTCQKCGFPKAWCRENDGGRERFDITEDFCWATYRLAQRQEKQDKEKVQGAVRRATQTRVRFRKGREMPIDAGLDI